MTDLNNKVAGGAKRIKDAVQAFNDADQGVRLALEAVVVDSNKDTNAGAYGDIEAYEIAALLGKDGNLTESERKQLDAAWRDIDPKQRAAM
ncbi:hypothetical protein [Streptomyces sp. CB03238]|uniref:hypothetical protein n=1 Tax=Streptomyces sp. CB03238 TaxID=1907777 RepID=UPI00117C63B8|nr:hypothetical protein [Streptomyces sp. CB03238]